MLESEARKKIKFLQLKANKAVWVGFFVKEKRRLQMSQRALFKLSVSSQSIFSERAILQQY
jgi:hypothetical protein